MLNGNLLQEPIIPKWLLKAILLLIALLILFFILWKTLLKPQVESAARDVAVEEVAPVSSAVAAIAPDVSEAPDAGISGSGRRRGGGGRQPRTRPQPPVTPALRAAAAEAEGCARQRVQRDHRADQLPVLSVDTPVGGVTAPVAQAPVGPGQTFALTDLVLQNPSGDQGRIRVLINGVTILESGTRELPRPRLPLRRPLRGSGGAVDLDRGRL